ncbi:hypothetical protein P691DRAFT_791972 [Macrolepiota fuliginosa MF-IS2]|uniref:Glucose-methanol-choline oxidoreductase N-terminal domain-containing protein n=1 Tax=Macrolepiota fuliginosa MF-IS2 TaxID=1400762 RepID=A0A9P6C2E4_9AGAR|nr:hypothetical protein P691DRAFT_791972 [Macrolepiota fuliginosa MF-IS2]
MFPYTFKASLILERVAVFYTHGFITQAEIWSGPDDSGLPEGDRCGPSVHGGSGNVNVSAVYYYTHSLNDLWVEAIKELIIVAFYDEMSGPCRNLTAAKELVVFGGVINDPQILFNPGIGPKEELEAFGVTSLIDNPGVGKNVSDQPAVPIDFSANLPIDKYDLPFFQ